VIQVRFRLYAELNDLLPQEKRMVAFDLSLEDGATTEGALGSLGVHSAMVDLILVNGESAALNRQLKDGDRVSVYPVFESMDISSLQRVRGTPLRKPRFIVDVGMERLALLLQRFGFDVIHGGQGPDHKDEGRILLTRDRSHIAQGVTTRALVVKSSAPCEQIREVLSRLDLPGSGQ
jgi:hypothetical protein